MAEGRKRGIDYLQITDRVGNVSWRRLRSIQLVNHLHFSLEAAFVPLLMSSCFFCLCGRIKYGSSKKQKTEAELLGLWWLAVLRNLIKLWERNDKRRRWEEGAWESQSAEEDAMSRGRRGERGDGHGGEREERNYY